MGGDNGASEVPAPGGRRQPPPPQPSEPGQAGGCGRGGSLDRLKPVQAAPPARARPAAANNRQRAVRPFPGGGLPAGHQAGSGRREQHRARSGPAGRRPSLSTAVARRSRLRWRRRSCCCGLKRMAGPGQVRQDVAVDGVRWLTSFGVVSACAASDVLKSGRPLLRFRCYASLGV